MAASKSKRRMREDVEHDRQCKKSKAAHAPDQERTPQHSRATLTNKQSSQRSQTHAHQRTTQSSQRTQLYDNRRTAAHGNNTFNRAPSQINHSSHFDYNTARRQGNNVATRNGRNNSRFMQDMHNIAAGAAHAMQQQRRNPAVRIHTPIRPRAQVKHVHRSNPLQRVPRAPRAMTEYALKTYQSRLMSMKQRRHGRRGTRRGRAGGRYR